MYTPIVKCKENDLIAVGKLHSSTRAGIKPLIEIPPLADKKNQKEKNVDAYLFKIASQIKAHVPLGEVYLDVIGLNPGLITSLNTDAITHTYHLLLDMGRIYTPAYGFHRDEDVDRDKKRWTEFKKIVDRAKNGFCFRIDDEDIDDPDETWEKIISQSGELDLKLNEVDLLLDLRDIGQKERSELKDSVLDFITTNPQIRNYRRVVLAGSSALRDLGAIESEHEASVTRQELYLWAELQQDVGKGFALCFGDYGIVHPNFVDSGPNKYMKAKIRYTFKDDIWYFKGHGLLTPLVDYEQYYELARKVRASELYLGRGYSHGDKYLDEVASEFVSPGDLGSWILADMNHHIEYAYKQIERLTQSVHTVDDLAQLEF